MGQLTLLQCGGGPVGGDPVGGGPMGDGAKKNNCN